MKRFLALSLCFGILSIVGFSGCGEETKVEEKTKVTTPDGTKEEKKTDEIKTTGDAKP